MKVSVSAFTRRSAYIGFAVTVSITLVMAGGLLAHASNQPPLSNDKYQVGETPQTPSMMHRKGSRSLCSGPASGVRLKPDFEYVSGACNLEDGLKHELENRRSRMSAINIGAQRSGVVGSGRAEASGLKMAVLSALATAPLATLDTMYSDAQGNYTHISLSSRTRFSGSL